MMAVISGAASRTAASTANCSVAADDGHPSQLPRSRRRTWPVTSSTPNSSMSPPWASSTGRASSRAVATRSATPTGCRPWTINRPATNLSPTSRSVSAASSGSSASSMTRVSPAPCRSVTTATTSSASAPARWSMAPMSASNPSIRSPIAFRSSDIDYPVMPWSLTPVGVCSFFRVLPFPRNMCTPQGRQGSKLRTVRMMSIPLKLSRSFSSKMGQPVTASS